MLNIRWELVTKELTYLVYIGGFTDTGVKAMSVHERRYHYDYIAKARDEEKQEIERIRGK